MRDQIEKELIMLCDRQIVKYKVVSETTQNSLKEFAMSYTERILDLVEAHDLESNVLLELFSSTQID